MRTNPPIIGVQKAFFNVNCGYVHLEQEIDEVTLGKENMPILERFGLIYLRSG